MEFVLKKLNIPIWQLEQNWESPTTQLQTQPIMTIDTSNKSILRGERQFKVKIGQKHSCKKLNFWSKPAEMSEFLPKNCLHLDVDSP